MKQPEDLIWDAVTDSAKKRFAYDDFQKVFAEVSNDNIAENVLFLVIAGLAAGGSTEAVAAEINNHLLLIAYSFPKDSLLRFISDRRGDLGIEIKATETAMAFLEMGLEPPGILVQVRRMLSRG